MSEPIKFVEEVKKAEEIKEREKKKQTLESIFTVYIKDDWGKLATDGKCYITSDKIQNLKCTGFINGIRMVKEMTGVKDEVLTAKCDYFERPILGTQQNQKFIKLDIRDENNKSIFEEDIPLNHQEIIKTDDKCPIDKRIKKDIISDGFNKSMIALTLLKMDEKQYKFDAQLIPVTEGDATKQAAQMGIKRVVDW